MAINISCLLLMITPGCVGCSVDNIDDFSLMFKKIAFFSNCRFLVRKNCDLLLLSIFSGVCHKIYFVFYCLSWFVVFFANFSEKMFFGPSSKFC
jgi:hypothetical protein